MVVFFQNENSLFGKIGQFVIVNGFEYFDILFVRLDKNDEIVGQLIIKLMYKSDGFFHLFEVHFDELFEQMLNANRNNDITSDISFQRKCKYFVNEIKLFLSLFVDLIHEKNALLDLLTSLDHVYYLFE